MNSSDLWRLDAARLNLGFASGDFTPVDATQSCLERTAACQPVLNAVLYLDEPGALRAAHESAVRWQHGEALGPLDGVPVTLKDNLHAAGLPTTWGSRLLAGFVASHDEAPVARLRAAGAVILGKTNLPEFAMQGYTANRLGPVTRNPWNPALTPGGSSGGAAASVAAGCGALALATDGGGSTRRPASHTGVVGFKPSPGLVPRGGGLPEIFLDYEQPGLLGRSVADVAAMAGALSAGTLALPATGAARILYVPRFASHPVDPGIARLVRGAARQLEALGHLVEEAGTFDLAEAVNAQWGVLARAGLAWMLGLAWRFPEFGLAKGQLPDLQECTQAARKDAHDGAQASATEVFAVLAAVQALQRRLAELFSRHDFILTPATAALPWPAEDSHPAIIDGQAVGPRGHAVFTAFANAAHLPAIALPCGFVGGLPTGLQLVGRPGADGALLALALQFEQAFAQPWTWPPPPPATMVTP